MVIARFTIRILFILVLVGLFQPLIAQDSAEFRARLINDSYQYFIAGDHNKVIGEMAQLGFKLKKQVHIDLNPSGVLDSLVFVNEGMKALFTSVDIDYLNNVSVIVQIENEDPGMILNEVKSKFDLAGYKANADFSIPGICAVFGEKGSHWVVDKRFPHWTYTNFESLYDHVMTIYENELVLNLSETIPDTWINDQEYATLSPTVSAIEVNSHF